MRHIYLVPAALLDGLKIGAHEAWVCPDPLMRLLMVDEWVSDQAQDTFEAHPEVLEIGPGDASKPVPPALVSAFTGSKIASLSVADTTGSALWKIRTQCPAARF